MTVPELPVFPACHAQHLYKLQGCDAVEEKPVRDKHETDVGGDKARHELLPAKRESGVASGFPALYHELHLEVWGLSLD
jgi:hypothetical protein